MEALVHFRRNMQYLPLPKNIFGSNLILFVGNVLTLIFILLILYRSFISFNFII